MAQLFFRLLFFFACCDAVIRVWLSLSAKNTWYELGKGTLFGS